MSVPARMGAWMSHRADVRVKRGSTCIRTAPCSVLALSGQRKATGWHSAILEPMIRTASEWTRSRGKVVEPPLPKETPRPGTVEECHIRAWFSTYTTPRACMSFWWT